MRELAGLLTLAALIAGAAGIACSCRRRPLAGVTLTGLALAANGTGWALRSDWPLSAVDGTLALVSAALWLAIRRDRRNPRKGA